MSYISEDDRIDREQAYRRKLREAAAVRQFRSAIGDLDGLSFVDLHDYTDPNEYVGTAVGDNFDLDGLTWLEEIALANAVATEYERQHGRQSNPLQTPTKKGNPQ